MKLLIGGSSTKIFHLQEFVKALEKLNVECKLVFDADYADGFPSRKLGTWFATNSKFNDLISNFKPDVIFIDRQRHFGLEAIKKEIPLLEVVDLKKYFLPTKNILEMQVASVRAVDGISFTISKGETLGLVGESGCGKSTVAKTLLRLIEPTSGQVSFFGTNLFDLKNITMRNIRKEMQIIFPVFFFKIGIAWLIVFTDEKKLLLNA